MKVWFVPHRKHYASATKVIQLFCLGETTDAYCENHTNTQIHSIGKMLRFCMLKQVVHIGAMCLKEIKKNINLCFLMPDSSIKMLFLLILFMYSEYSLNIGTNCHKYVKEMVHKTKLPCMVSILHIKQYSLIWGGGAWLQQ